MWVESLPLPHLPHLEPQDKNTFPECPKNSKVILQEQNNDQRDLLLYHLHQLESNYSPQSNYLTKENFLPRQTPFKEIRTNPQASFEYSLSSIVKMKLRIG